jgi:sialidase-1
MKSKILSVVVIILVTNFLTGNSQDKNRPEEPSRKQGQYFRYDLFVSGENNVVEYRIPSIVTTNKGTLIAVCDARVEKRGDAPNNIDLVMKKSSDRGKTWSKSKVIVGFPENEAACDPSMVVDKQTGTIWLVYDYAIPDPQGDRGRILKIHLIKSDDEGDTWSSPVDLSYLTKGKNFWLQNGPGVGLYTDGVIVFPVYCAEPGRKVIKQIVLPYSQQTALVYSKDHGKTWALSNGVGDYNPEPQIVSLKGSRIMVNMRRPYGYGNRQVAVTGDLGNTWSEVSDDSTLIESGCMASLINYKYKKKSLLLFSNPADKKERKNLVLRISNDEGKSWQKRLSVYNGSTGYSCLTQLPNGNVGLMYEADNYKRIVFVEIPFKELK